MAKLSRIDNEIQHRVAIVGVGGGRLLLPDWLRGIDRFAINSQKPGLKGIAAPEKLQRIGNVDDCEASYTNIRRGVSYRGRVARRQKNSHGLRPVSGAVKHRKTRAGVV